MKATLFIDVDGVLTVEPANLQLARRLGVDETLVNIERDYSAGRMDTDEFGRRLVDLFSQAGLTRSVVDEHFDHIRLRVEADRLLRRSESVYLVSSGPNYFVERLAKNYAIAPEHVLCSKYEFEPGPDGRIRACSEPVGQLRKAQFVKARVRKGQLSIGIGDTPEVDGQFLSHCDVKILLGELRNEYLCVRDLGSLIGLIESLESLPTSRLADLGPNDKVRVFIGSSSEGLDAAGAIQAELERMGKGQIEATVWEQNDGSIGETILDSLMKRAAASDYAILVLSPDDETKSRNERSSVPRDNVVFECGLFLGALGRGRVFLVSTGEVGALKIPSDLGGVIYKQAMPRQDGNLKASVNAACIDIFAAIRSKAPGPLR